MVRVLGRVLLLLTRLAVHCRPAPSLFAQLFHAFQDCIDPWLETKAVCAYCKAKVEARKTCCDRVRRAASERLGLNLVAPTTIRFSSSRRTYTNEDVSGLRAHN